MIHLKLLYMKKLIVFISLLMSISCTCSAQIKLAGYFDGFWSSWGEDSRTQVYGNYEGFIIHTQEDGPWNYRFKFEIDNFNVPNKKQRKKTLKKRNGMCFLVLLNTIYLKVIHLH